MEEAAAKERRLEQGEAVTFRDRLEVGRAPGNGVRVVDPYVSAHHCVIERRAPYVHLAGSFNYQRYRSRRTPVLGDCPLPTGRRHPSRDDPVSI